MSGGQPRAAGGRQVIPRPAGAHPGTPAPWAGLDPAARHGLDLAGVHRALAARPGGPVTPRLDGSPDPGAPSAVLVALFDEDGEARVVLTRRAAHLRSHRGEVAFPGGRLDPGEEPESGARREALEEVGLDPALPEVLGRLTPLSTFSSSSHITPVVAALPGRPRLCPNPAEVELGFDVSLAELAEPEVFREERWRRPGMAPPRHVAGGLGPDGSFPVWFFELEHDTIWGATARVLVELLRLVLGV